MKKDYTKSDDRAFNISFIASLITIFLFLIAEIIFEAVKIFISVHPIFIKLGLMIVIGILVLYQWNRWNKNQRVR